MRKTTLLIFIPLTILFISCQSGTGPIDSEMNILPLQVGNFWIYERNPVDSLGNIIGESVYDTLIVKTTKIIDGKTAFEIVFNRDGYVPTNGYVQSNGVNLKLYAHSLLPIIPVDTISCWSRIPERWRDLTKNTSNTWNDQDSFNNGKFTSLVSYVDKNGKIIDQKIVMSETYVNVKTSSRLSEELIFTFGGLSYNSLKFEYKSQRFIRMITPENAIFPKMQNFTYFENGRVVLADDIKLQVTYSENIGITEFNEDFAYGFHPVRYKSNLIKYFLN